MKILNYLLIIIIVSSGCSNLLKKEAKKQILGSWIFDHIEIPEEDIKEGEDPIANLPTKVKFTSELSKALKTTYSFRNDNSYTITINKKLDGSIGTYEIQEDKKLLLKNKVLDYTSDGNYFNRELVEEMEIYSITEKVLKLKIKNRSAESGYPSLINVFIRLN